MNEIGDEFLYVFSCPYFDIKRRACIPRLYRIRPNAIKFNIHFKFQVLLITHNPLGANELKV